VSNLLSGRWKQYYQVPMDPRVSSLPLAAHRYYCFLMQGMNRHSAGELHFSNAELSRGTGIRDHRTLSSARAILINQGLIACRKVPPGIYAHTVLDQDGIPIPPPTDRKGVRRYLSEPSGAVRSARRSQPHSHGASAPRDPATYGQSSIQEFVGNEGNRRRCSLHGNSEHWQRGNEWICDDCHPNPNKSRQPTAREVGFVVFPSE
jgi:hypothetical protein